MPQPYTPRPSARLEADFRVLERRSDCAVQIAVVGAAWAQLEQFLARIFGYATTQNIKVGTASGGVTTEGEINPVGVAAVSAVDSLIGRLEITKAVLALTMPSTLCDQFEDMTQPIRGAAKKRNAVAHCRWHITDSYPNDVIAPAETPGSYVRYTVKDLSKIADQIAEQTAKLSFFGSLCFAHLSDEAMRKAGHSLIPSPPAPKSPASRPTPRGKSRKRKPPPPQS